MDDWTAKKPERASFFALFSFASVTAGVKRLKIRRDAISPRADQSTSANSSTESAEIAVTKHRAKIFRRRAPSRPLVESLNPVRSDGHANGGPTPDALLQSALADRSPGISEGLASTGFFRAR
ncbi:MAG: hypothetical protein RQ741_07840 [Wenzhouxiangellaceae bacterium]|nr:hypothetical protein [Wenzhouxiangellaceae bacterium]